MLEDFPVHLGDNWKFVADAEVSLTRKPLDKASGSFGYTGAVLNASPLINQSVWVVGDSFTHALREYFHATFKEVHDIDHSGNEMPTLPQELINAAKKPDRVIVEKWKGRFKR